MEPILWWQSKTIWINLLMAIAAVLAIVFPAGAEFIKQYFAEGAVGWALINILLRLITNKEIK